MKRFLLFNLFILLSVCGTFRQASAWHLMGGELTYVYDGSTTGGDFYIVTLNVYRYCDSTALPPTPLDPNMFLGIYPGDSANPTSPLNWYETEALTLIHSDFISYIPNNPLCSFTSSVCIERGEYTATLLLPTNPGGFHLIVERCCRNNNIVNISNPGGAGMSFYAYIPPGIENSTPQITDVSVPYVCTSDTISLINNGYDPDGDSLVYSFATPFNGNSNSGNPSPDPLTNNNPYTLPISDVTFAPGYSISSIFGAGGYASIDPLTGLTRYFVPNQGFYVVAIEIREYRNGVFISSMRRDLQFIAIACPQNNTPQFDIAATPSTTFSVGEGQLLCFNATFNDPDGDSLYLSASGPLLNGAIVNPPGTMSNQSGSGTVTGQFCWTPTCGMSRSAPYQFSVTVTDNGCPQKSTSQIFSVYVTAGPASLYPTVAVAQNPPGPLCQGSITSFIANTTHAGNHPHFYWQVNGIPAGIDSSVFSSALLNDGDQITVTMISNATCLFTDTAYSAPFIVNMSSQPGAQVTITSNPATTLCPQQICLFSSAVSNGGSSPVYQWNINGNPGGTNNPQFTAANPSGIMAVYLTVTPSTGCPPQTSNTIIFNIQPQLTPAITLTASQTDSICPGQPVLFQAVSSATGMPPVYSWTLNGSGIGGNVDSLLLPQMNDGDLVNVSVTSSYPCLSPVHTYANPLAFHLYPPTSADLTDGPVEVCFGSPLTLNLTAQGGNSATYSYQWSAGNATGPENIFIPVTSGYYYATVDEACFPPVTDSILVTILPVPVSDFTWSPEKPSIFTPRVQFTDRSVDAHSWQWNLGDQTITNEQNPVHDYLSGGVFPVELITTNDVGCTDTIVRVLEVEEYITVYIPNSFTPNGDSKNDTFGLTGYGTGGYELSVFNRWGQQVFHDSGAQPQWDGSAPDGSPSPAGLYLYLITVNNDSSKKPYTGTVTLVR